MKTILLARGFVIKVDDPDFDSVSEFHWFPHKMGKLVDQIYPARNVQISAGKWVRQALHRFILGLEYGNPNRADHIDGDKWNNCRSNLRVCSQLENNRAFKQKQQNVSSQFRGVCRYHKDRWTAQITADYKKIHLGVFDDEVEAAKAYDAAAKTYFREFSSCNFQ